MTTIKLDPGAALLLDALHGAGHAAYAVGGCVRDSLLGLDPHDWDLCTSARPEQVMALFGEEKCIPTGLQHGTVTVKQGGRLYETTTFRTEGAYSDGRHPDAVCFVPDVREDLARRDFTINAMAYSAEEGLIDPFGGRDDLAAHLVRAVGEPERRFEEDALRILRLYRFAARFGFAIDPATGAAARALGPHLDCVSAERIQEELLKLLAAPRPGSYLEPAVLAVVLPELEPEEQPERFAELCRTIDRIEPTAENVPTRLAALLWPLGEAGARKALRKLKCSNALTDEVTALEREAGGGAGSFLLGHESGHSIARPIALRAAGSHPSGRSSEKLPTGGSLPHHCMTSTLLFRDKLSFGGTQRMQTYTTQMDAARKGIITPEMEIVAKKEYRTTEEIRQWVAEGKVAIPANKHHTCLNPEGVGSMLRTKINVNLGVSRDCKDYNIEMQKVMSAVNMGAEAIMDLSSHGNTQPFRQKLTHECPVMIGTVPVYDSVIHYQRDLAELTAQDFIDVVRLHA